MTTFQHIIVEVRSQPNRAAVVMCRNRSCKNCIFPVVSVLYGFLCCDCCSLHLTFSELI